MFNFSTPPIIELPVSRRLVNLSTITNVEQTDAWVMVYTTDGHSFGYDLEDGQLILDALPTQIDPALKLQSIAEQLISYGREEAVFATMLAAFENHTTIAANAGQHERAAELSHAATVIRDHFYEM